MPEQMTTPAEPITVVGIDPGVKHTGYAVLREPDALLHAGTWIPRTTLSFLDRQLWLIAKIQDCIQASPPAILAFEDFTWRVGKDGALYVRGRAWMDRLIGAIHAQALVPPYPVLWPLQPGDWGRQLTGSTRHDKPAVARAVNLRLGTAFTGDYYSNHTSDAVGLALVAMDTWRLWQRGPRGPHYGKSITRRGAHPCTR